MTIRMNRQANAAGEDVTARTLAEDSPARMIDPGKCRFCGKPSTQREPVQCPAIGNTTKLHLYTKT